MQLNNQFENIVLTGIPRSGTTLTCHLLNKLPDCVALHEPLNPLDLINYSRADLPQIVFRYFTDQRQQILTTGTATSKSVGGQVPDNPVAEFDSVTGKRVRKLDGRMIFVNKQLSDAFTLVIKQPAFFTALLAELVEFGELKCFAVIRNPLSVLLSWNTVDMLVAQGRVPAAEAFDSELSCRLNSVSDIYERQVILLDWFFSQYLNYLPPENILCYEKTIQSGGSTLSAIQSSAQKLCEPLSSKNANKLYDSNITQQLLENLMKKQDAAFWEFYSEEDVIRLANIN